jgi:hypothetical protein
LVLVLLVGMAIVPIALSSSSQPAGAPPAPPAPAAAKSNAPAEQVVLDDPGVRDYKRRLSGEAPTDPFVQKFTAPTASLSQALQGAAGAAPSGATGPTESADTGTTGSGTVPGDTGGAPVTQTESQSVDKFIIYRLDVKTGPLGEELTEKENVGVLTSLPNDSVQALAYLGVTVDSDLDPKRAFFLVSANVSSVSGDYSCVFGEPCQVVALKPGGHVDLVWLDGRTYRVKLVGFNTHFKDKPLSVQEKSDSGKGSSGARKAREGKPSRSFAPYFSF